MFFPYCPEHLKKQWYVFNNLNIFCGWCCSDYSNIEGITGFSEEDSQSVFSFMKSAVKLAKSDDGQVTVFCRFPKCKNHKCNLEPNHATMVEQPMYDSTKPRFSQLWKLGESFTVNHVVDRQTRLLSLFPLKQTAQKFVNENNLL